MISCFVIPVKFELSYVLAKSLPAVGCCYSLLSCLESIPSLSSLVPNGIQQALNDAPLFSAIVQMASFFAILSCNFRILESPSELGPAFDRRHSSSRSLPPAQCGFQWVVVLGRVQLIVKLLVS